MSAAFQTLADDHRARLGVTWSFNGGNHIMGLLRQPHSPKGNGAVAMAEICTLADRLGVPLALGTSVAKLKPWYESFNFKPTHELKNGNYVATFYRRKPR